MTSIRHQGVTSPLAAVIGPWMHGRLDGGQFQIVVIAGSAGALEPPKDIRTIAVVLSGTGRDAAAGAAAIKAAGGTAIVRSLTFQHREWDSARTLLALPGMRRAD